VDIKGHEIFCIGLKEILRDVLSVHLSPHEGKEKYT
jgi:hypothetical protein